MSNPRYYDDVLRLDKTWDRHAILNKETVILVVGTNMVVELLDRPVAEFLRDHIDQRGAEYPFRRGIVVTDQAWFDEAAVLQDNPVISIGGPPANRLSAEFNDWPPVGIWRRQVLHFIRAHGVLPQEFAGIATGRTMGPDGG